MIGPMHLVARLESRPDQVGAWLVSPAADGETFTIIDASLQDVTLNRVRADLETGRIRHAWFLSKHIVDLYRNLLRGMDYLLRTTPKPHAVNISVGPSMKHAPLDPADPIHTIFHNATQKGLFIVVAHGNEGNPDGSRDGIINPWAATDYAISVGACDDDGTAIWPNSSRGLMNVRATWPDLVAPCWSGLDPSVRGTSFAAPRVAEAAAKIIHFLQLFAAEAGPDVAMILTVPKDTFIACRAMGRRMAGELMYIDGAGAATFRFDPTPSPNLVRQLLRDFTRPVPGALPHIAGAGMLDSARLNAFFGAFKVGDAKFLDIDII